MKTPKPRDHAEEVALFRSQVIGALTHQSLDRGQLREALGELSEVPRRAPGAKLTRKYSPSTLERWYYSYKNGGLEGLLPRGRSDRGRARELSEEQRELLSAIRREHPSASVALILRTLELEGRVSKGSVSETTIRRYFRQEGLSRQAARLPGEPKQRLRWEAEYAGALFHADVCHFTPGIIEGEQKKPVRIHGIMDDASRYVVGLEAMHTEQEVDMLRLFSKVVQADGAPAALYLDNGSTYPGETLSVACHRMGTSLLHAQPYDPQARGKMERFCRTLRQGCLDHLPQLGSLHELNVRLWAWLDGHYHQAAHGGLLGRNPAVAWSDGQERREPVAREKLRAAFEVKERRRVRRDSTLDIGGQAYELDRGHLAGQLVHAAWCEIDEPLEPWVEVHGERYQLRPVQPRDNAKRKRERVHPESSADVHRAAFDPAQSLLDKASGRKPGGER